MKTLICATAILALTAGAAFAEQKAAPAAATQRVVMTDAQLDATTGGKLNVLSNILNGNSVLSGNSGLVNTNVNAPINVGNIALLSAGKQSSNNNQSSGQSINTGVIGKHH